MSNEPLLQSVMNLIRRSSVSRLKILSGFQDVQLSEIPVDPLVFAHWMSFILVSGKAVRIIFKAHFMTESAKYFAAKPYRTTRDKVTQEQALDFFKEFCNLTAGQLKIDLASNNVKVGASLPGLTRGFDEIFYTHENGKVKNYWQLTSGLEKFECSAKIEVFSDFKIDDTLRETKKDQGDVEFL